MYMGEPKVTAVKLPELAALIAPFAGVIWAGIIPWERKQTATTIPACSCATSLLLWWGTVSKKIVERICPKSLSK